MSNTKELLEEIYPALYSIITVALPEFNFKRIKGGYVSTTDIKVTGERGAKGKVYIYDNNIKHLIDYSRNPISLWDYLQQRDKLTQQDTLKLLAQLSGVKLPQGDYNTEEYITYKNKTKLWEDVNSYLLNNLDKPEAKAVKDYLTKRGYTAEDIKALELGFIGSQDKLKKYLKGLNYTQDEIAEIKLHTAIGESHTLTIPLREPSGSILGLSVRNINFKEGDKNGKYIYSTGLSKTDKLFNLRPFKTKKSIVLVEGLLDCLLASARGIENVVALGGKSLNINQLNTAIKYGVEKIIICLDNEEATIPNILRAIELIRDNSEVKIYVAQLPERIKDTDELIRTKGAEALTKVIDEAITYWEYQLNQLAKNYYNLENPTAQDEEEFLQNVVLTASRIREPIDRDRYIKLFLTDEGVKDLGISQHTLDVTVENIRAKRDSIKQTKQLRALLDEVTELQSKGNTEEALDKLHIEAREIKQLSNKTTFESLLIPLTQDEIAGKLKDKPESLKTGYIIKEAHKKEDNEELLLPAGAITIFSAPTSHCKTTMLINLALETVERYKDKHFHLFSFEEDRETIILKALNTYLSRPLSINNLRTLKSYYTLPEAQQFEYFNKGGEYKITAKEFKHKSNEFFKEIIGTQRLNIHYVSYSSDTLLEAIEYLNKRDNVGAVFIDYMQLLKKAQGRFNTRQEELKHICLELKDVAVDTGLPIILGAQFNREVINHSKIHSTNIGEAGDIERVANTIIGLWNNNFKPMDFKGTEKNHYEKNKYLEDNTIYGKVLKMREAKAGIEFLLRFKGNEGKIESITNNINKF
jgi:DNA primase catalytic core